MRRSKAKYSLTPLGQAMAAAHYRYALAIGHRSRPWAQGRTMNDDERYMATLALIESVARFNPNQGLKFTTYLAAVIKLRLLELPRLWGKQQARPGFAAVAEAIAEADCGEIEDHRPPCWLARGRAAIRSIPPAVCRQQCRDVLEAVYVDGYTLTDVSERTGISLSRISQVHKEAIGNLSANPGEAMRCLS